MLLEWGNGTAVLVDAGPDFREQALRHRIGRLDAIWFTHSHADHTGGLDDLRPYCFGNRVLPVRALSSVLDEIRQRFGYAFRTDAAPSGVSHPMLSPTPIDGPFEFGDRTIVPLPAEHGPFPVVGFRIGDLAYLTDVSAVPESTLALMEGVKTLVLSALRELPHPTHLSFEQAVAMARRIGANRTWFTHFAHGRVHAEIERMLPEGIAPAWDGLVIEG